MFKNGKRSAARFAVVAAGVALAVTGAVVPAAASDSGQTPTTPLPSSMSCGVDVVALDAQNRVTAHRYSSEAGSAYWRTEVRETTELGFTPRAIAVKGSNGAGDPNSLGSSGIQFYANSADGSFYLIGVNEFGGITKKLVNSTWGKVRLMAAVPTLSGQPGAFVYAIHDSGGLYRYSTPTGPENLRGTTYIGSGWGGVKTLTWYSIKTLPDGTSADVLLATTTAGQLVEYTIPHNYPTKWTRKDIRSSTWQNITSLTPGNCVGGTTGWETPFIGTLSNGEAYLYLDKHSQQQASTDILMYGRIATGWGPHFYSGGWRG